MPPKEQLPSKENGLFKRILKCYELKQYRQGIKYARQILSNPKFSEHGETLAMKGLILNCLHKKDEAYEYVRRGLRNDLTSHVCWHVFGLLQRSDHKYDEAIKAYRNALRWDKDNLQIMRDLSLLQIQMRDYDGYRETRQRLLELRPGQRASWIGYAISWHLLKDYDMALCVLDEFRKTLTPKPYDYEFSELCLYHASILEEAGKYQECLSFIDKHDTDFVDRLCVEESKARLHYKLGDNSRAATIYKNLLDRNPENKRYYQELENCTPPCSEEERLRLYTQVLDTHPRASLPKKLPLKFLSGDTLKQFIDEFLRKSIKKGVPSLFVNLRSLYSDPVKVNLIEQLVLDYHSSLKQHRLFNPNDADTNCDLESPVTVLWTEVFLAQHYSYLGDYSKALDYINSAINDTPTLPELYMIKGRIYKHAGNVYEAYRCLDEAQSLDTADRYINCKCAKFMLRNNMIEDAELMCQKFTREGASATENLNEMQCMWFQTEMADAYHRKGEYGNALKKCHEVDKHFTEITEDQFDFHTYCLRKMTLRSYVSLLRLEDVLRNHRFYFKAAKAAIQIYLHLHLHPVGDKGDGANINPDNLSPSELKKLRNKQKKAAKKAQLERQRQEEEAKRQQSEKSNKTPEDADNVKKVDDLVPEKLERCDDPLEQAIKFLTPLQTLCADRIESHVLAYEIYSRKDKPLLMLKAIKGGHKLRSSDPDFHYCMVRFRYYIEQKQASLSPQIKSVIDNEMKSIYGSHTSQSLNQQYLENNSSIVSRLAVARSIYFMNKSNQQQALEMCTQIGDHGYMKECSMVYDILKSGEFGEVSDTADKYKAKCHQLFPIASIFAPPIERNGPINSEELETSCHEP